MTRRLNIIEICKNCAESVSFLIAVNFCQILQAALQNLATCYVIHCDYNQRPKCKDIMLLSMARQPCKYWGDEKSSNGFHQGGRAFYYAGMKAHAGEFLAAQDKLQDCSFADQ